MRKTLPEYGGTGSVMMFAGGAVPASAQEGQRQDANYGFLLFAFLPPRK